MMQRNASAALIVAFVLAALAPAQEVVVPEQVFAAPPVYYDGPFETFEDRNDGMLLGDPLLDPPGLRPGVFAAAELDVIGVHVRDRLNAPRVLFGDRIAVPGAPLCWTASPHFELGYRFGQGYGAALLGYESLVTEGCTTTLYVPANTGVATPAHLHSRVNLNVVDLDYQQHEWGLGPQWDMIWQVGVRIGSSYYDTHRCSPVLHEKASNSYVGVGPHAGLDLRRRLFDTPLSLRGKVEGAGLIGHFNQSFETIAGGVGEALRVDGTQWVPILRVLAGLHYAPGPRCQFGLGYVFEGWWYTGKPAGSTVPLTANGLFFRAEWRY
ncbi:MAG: Lpg1974 family pore-forming outer membrane protein [Gemmataceae bacterium]